MSAHPKTKLSKLTLLLVFFTISSIPVKAQLYAGGGFSYYYTNSNYPDSKIRHFNISPELGYRYHRFSAGLAFSYISEKYRNDNHSVAYILDKRYTFEPYFRYDLIVRKKLGFFTDVFYNWTHYSDILYYDTHGAVHVSHLAGVSPGIYYKLCDRLIALFRFGFAGYSSSAEANGFKGLGVDLSMNTSRIGFYYSFW